MNGAAALDELRKLQKEKREELDEIGKQIQFAESQTVIRCGSCETEAQVRDMEYIQTHWYERPHGCTGGDTWHQGEGQAVCPGCGGRLRLYNHPELVRLKPLFKSVTDEYDRA